MVSTQDFDFCNTGSSPVGAVMKTYELFTGEQLKIAEKIQQRRYQMLIHSCLYYKLSESIVSDYQWSKWAVELKELQEQYPEIAEQVTLHEYFIDWDGSSGAFLPIDLDWVITKAKSLLPRKSIVEKKVTVKKKRLF